ncbi:hypothetical protein FKW77_003183 [Venturia effusa]|uniref:Uncharacterized protein n=1 Tax=Venturia effusa TaxID=50376 RepID=A0A517L103_9PEZI|nr:hypothetical protein FKW77_003183 [Venturia effusa]
MNDLKKKPGEQLCVRKPSFDSRSGRRPRPAPINTAGIRTANPIEHIEKSDNRTPSTPKASYFSPQSSAQSTPQAIITAIRWQSPSTSTTSRSSELAFSFSPTSPRYLDSAFPSPDSPMETSCLPSGRVLKSPFSYTGSPYPVSPPLSASRLYPNTYRNIPPLETHVRTDEQNASSAERVMPTPASIQRTRRGNPQLAGSPADLLPTTPVMVDVGYPVILDPAAPKMYTSESVMLNRPNPLPSSRSPPGPVRLRTTKRGLKRGQDPYRQDLRGQGSGTQRTISEPRLQSDDELMLAVGYGISGASRSGNMSDKRNRRLPQVDGYGYYESTSYVTPSEDTEGALLEQISRA